MRKMTKTPGCPGCEKGRTHHHTVKCQERRRRFALGLDPDTDATEQAPPGLGAEALGGTVSANTMVEAVGTEDTFAGRPIISVGPDTTREVRILVTSPPWAKMPHSTPVTFRITESVMGEVVTAKDTFKAPEKP